MKKWSVYYQDSTGMREGTEIIEAENREEALRIYRRYFNVNDNCKVIPIYEKNPLEDK